MSKDFLGKAAPPNYIAGLGRGATGFTTRSDIGPAREGPADLSDEAIEKLKRKRAAEDEEDSGEYQDPDNEVGLFNSMPYEADDEEADMIYEAVDAKMDERRKARREAREREELLRFRKERPKIQQQFGDLKRGLSAVTDEEWANIPEVGDLVGRNKKKVNTFKERFFAIPDSVIQGAAQSTGFHTTLDPSQQQYGGIATPADGMMTNFVEIGQARDKVLSLKLDQVRDSVSGSTTVDPKGYL
ncbi:MAG: PRP1 splicing factor, N-terminal-domain-containing protein, partial [Olpidium bornovanus]